MFPRSVLLIFRHLFPIVLQHFQYSFGIINFRFLIIFSPSLKIPVTYHPNNLSQLILLYLKTNQFIPSSSANAFVYSIFVGFFPNSLGSDNQSSNSSIAFLTVLFITIPALSPFFCSGLLIWFLHRSHKRFGFFKLQKLFTCRCLLLSFTTLPAFSIYIFGKYGALLL